MIAFLLTGSCVAFAQKSNTTRDKTKPGTADTAAYSCPMHPGITGNKPGKCSQCGMTMVKKLPSSMAYFCTMHREVTSNQPGKCSICGMKLEPSPNEKMKQGDLKKYHCPMHHDITSGKPGKCSKCQMALIETGEDHSGHQH